MTEHVIPFEKLQWERPVAGAEQKIYVKGDRRIRLLRFNDTFFEPDWCTAGHIGFVLEGEMKISFNGRTQSYKKGDGLWIEAGEQSKHKVIMEEGKQVTLILFENAR